MDLFGDHSLWQVTAVTSLLESALVLTLAVFVVLLSVRVAQQSVRPTVAAARLVRSHVVSPLGLDAGVLPVRRVLRDSLPPRAPPPLDPCQRFRPTPPGASSART